MSFRRRYFIVSYAIYSKIVLISCNEPYRATTRHLLCGGCRVGYSHFCTHGSTLPTAEVRAQLPSLLANGIEGGSEDSYGVVRPGRR